MIPFPKQEEKLFIFPKQEEMIEKKKRILEQRKIESAKSNRLSFPS